MTLVGDTWREIGRDNRHDRGWTVRRLFPGTLFELLAAKRGGDDAEALLMEIANRSLPPAALLPDCVGFQVLLESVEVGPRGRCRLCLVLKDRRYIEVFATLVQDVAERVVAAADEPAAARVLLSRLHAWQRFLERFGLNSLSREEQAGLFAELHALESELLPVLEATSAIRSWRGPYGEPHDFRACDLAIEVKATTAQAASSFPVSNLAQLDKGTAARLFICHYVLELDAELGVSLTDLIARLRSRFTGWAPAAAAEFDAALLEAGYLDLHAGTYRDRRFIVRKLRCFEVREGFPRLTAATVPESILSARYSVALAGCAAFEINENDFRSSLKAMVS